jgi:hypothetical protein
VTTQGDQSIIAVPQPRSELRPTIDATVFSNVSQECLVTTTDRAKLHLIGFSRAIRKGLEWKGWSALAGSFLTTLVTSDFKVRFGLSAETWAAFFLIACVISVIMAMRSGIAAWQTRKDAEINKVIEDLKSTKT